MNPDTKKKKRIMFKTDAKAAIKTKATELMNTTIDTEERAKKLLKENRAISFTRGAVPGTGKERKQKRKVLKEIVKRYKNQ